VGVGGRGGWGGGGGVVGGGVGGGGGGGGGGLLCGGKHIILCDYILDTSAAYVSEVLASCGCDVVQGLR